MPTDVIMAAIVGGGSAAIINGVFTVINNLTSSRTEERKHIRAIATQMALEQWKFIYERDKGAWVDPEALIITAMNAANVVAFTGSRMHSEQRIRAELEKGFARANVVQQIYEQRKKDKSMPK